MSEQQGEQGNQNGNGTGGTVAPEWAKDLPPALSSVVAERKFASPGDVIAALVNTEKAAGEYKTAAEQAAEKLKGFEGKAPNWMEGLDEKAQAVIKTKGWGGADGKTLVADMFKSYANLETAFGAEKAGRVLLKPKDANDKEALGVIYSALGRPESKEKYTYTPPQGAQPDTDLINFFRDVAFEAGMNQQQFTQATAKWDQRITGLVKQHETDMAGKLKAEQDTLAKEWGPKDGPSWSRMMGLAEKGMKEFKVVNADNTAVTPEGKNIWEALQGAIGYAATAKMFADIGERMTEGGGPIDPGKGTFAMTPAEAKQAYGERRRDPEWLKALGDPNHPGHKGAAEERQRYLSLIYPG